jgi:large subunit ribosomal protein L5
MANLKEKFTKELAPSLQEKTRPQEQDAGSPPAEGVINMGFGIVEKDVQKTIVDDLGKLAGQKPVLCKARKSISNSSLRERQW